MRIVAKNGMTYTPTAEDRLWLLRAVEAEGPVRSDVARALVNLFAYLRAEKADKRTLAEVVRAYAQPVNPRWYADGDLFRRDNSPPTNGQLEVARRREAVHSARTEFSPETESAVEQAFATSFPSDVTDYAAPTLDATRKGYAPRSAPRAGVNRLWSRAPGWAGYAVDVDGAGAGGIALAVLALSLIVVRGLK